MVDIIKIIDQLKVFIREEKDTVIGLLFFLAAELIGISYIINDFFVSAKDYFGVIFGAVALLTFLAWLYNRKIWIPRKQISIAVANFNILSLDISSGLQGEARVNLEREIRRYLLESLHGHKNKLHFDSYISVVDIPSRVVVTEKNARRVTRKVRANILIWGNVKYLSSSKVRIEPRFEFYVEPKDVFYHKFRERLMQGKSYTINLSEELVSAKESKLAAFIHYLTYLGLLFEGISANNHREFEKAQEVFSQSLAQITKVQNPSQEMLDLYVVFSFYQAKNLHLWGNELIRKGERGEAFARFDAASKELFMVSRRAKKGDYSAKDFLEHSYLYGVHLLIKEGKLSEAQKRIDAVEKKWATNPELVKGELDVLSKKSAGKMKAKVTSIEKKMGKNPIIAKRLGDYYYGEKQFDKASKLYEKKLQLEPRDVYNPGFFDIQELLHLLNSHVHTLRLLKAQRDVLRVAVDEAKNLVKKKL